MSRILVVSQTPTIDTSIYASGDAIGGLLTFNFSGSDTGYQGVITKIVVIDKASQAAPLDLILFDRTFTATADQAPFDPTDADLANCIGHISIAATDYVAFNDNSVASKTSGRQLPFYFLLNTGQIFGQLVVRSAPTYAAATDLTVKVIIEVDD